MSGPGRVLFYVQHLLGIGHQRRGATLTRAMQDAGLDVTYVSGGHGIPNLDLGGAELVQLPPVRAVDLYFKKLVDENDQPINDAWRERRRDGLLAVWRRIQPHVIVLELYPFGRRQMRFELLPLLDAALASERRPIIASSVRDILVASPKPERLVEMLKRVETYFDHVLVHGDPGLVPFESTFPHAAQIAGKLHYTGYVVDRTGQRGGPGSPGWDEVLVSSGGGAMGDALMRSAIQARAKSTLNGKRWRVLVGVKVPEEEYQALIALAAESGKTGDIVVERARGDFPTMLMNCALSISQGGYNTLMECMHAGCRAIIVPYAGGLETEQTLRAELLAKRGVITVLAETELSPGAMAEAVERSLAGPGAATAGVRTDGAANGARQIAAWAGTLDW
ncbi:MAG: glycosyltransferase [Alphaproteobacteria bacterium]|jgi:predicted glycosyltransferase|nr:glycosyl transferase [Rhodospirillaceae bacterium]MDP6022204.1 glycosyltransferase [Alphaproteobacteria bacterium]MDP6255596.1 glycosyltransferase [Alphaproteobacteria bacterium]MDP7053742.1 glycosyltransferase [Alphaproteobacteria bacterium]MDP7227945.1 glycosyltransferase [Alphaproteobacteria bacterium]|tara:strand:+ start:9571 stop:10749 length:1179 start_codon:yes stop_codon:yes gene_type:complete